MSVIVTPASPPAALAAKAATMAIPIVFSVGEDPVGFGRINFFGAELTAKKLGLLRELLPKAARIGVLVNPSNVVTAESAVRDVKAAASAIGLQIQVLNASNGDEIDAAFAGRRPPRRPRCGLEQPARPNCHPGGAPLGSPTPAWAASTDRNTS